MNKVNRKVGRPRTKASTPAVERKREYDRLRTRLKRQYEIAGQNWNDYKDVLSYKSIKEHLKLDLKMYPNSPASKRRLKNASELIRQGYRDRIEFMKSINEQGADVTDKKGNIIRKGLGKNKVMRLFYNLEASNKTVSINGKQYKFLQEGGLNYVMHNGRIQVVHEVSRTLKPSASDMELDFSGTQDDISFEEYDEDIGMEDFAQSDDSDFFPDDYYDIVYEFDDRFEGAEYRGGIYD